MKAESAFINGIILTPSGKAEALAVCGGRILKIGTNEEIRSLVGPKTRVIDLKGKTVLPGLIDAHVHLSGYGLALSQLDLRGTRSIEELKKAVKEKALSLRKGEWILGRGWDQELFKEKRYPTRWDLDEVSPENPVFLRRVCGHIAVVNSKALEIASITKETEDPPRGKIDRDERGEPTGILREWAMDLVYEKIPPPNLEQLKEALERAIKEAVKRGLTTIHFICSDRFPDELRALQLLRKEGKLLLRIYLVPPYEFLEKLEEIGILSGFGDSMLKIGGIKILEDGSLGGRTAALEEPYADMPEKKGMLIYTPEQLKEMVLKIHKAGFQAAIHAIGDRAIKVTLDAIENAVKYEPRDHRHRIEHASVVSPEIIERMKEVNVVAVCQPHFIFTDFWAKDRVGPDRARWVYALKSLKENVVVAGSSDCPVEPIDPLKGIWAAVTRPFLPENEKLTVEEAIDIYTRGGAYASFEEDEKGTIEEGKLADLVVLSEDPTKIDSEKIKEIAVDIVVVEGKIVYERRLKIPRIKEMQLLVDSLHC